MKTKVKYYIYLFFFLSLLYTIFAFYKIITTSTPDFRVLYLASIDLLRGNNPYLNPDIFTGVGYPPNTLLFYFSFIAFKISIARLLFSMASLASLISSIYLSLLVAAKKVNKEMFLLITSLALLSFPVKFTFGMGQNNTITLLMLVYSYYLFQHKKDRLSGIMFGLAASFKTVFIFIFLFFLLKKKYKLIFYSILTIAATVAITVAISNVDLFRYYTNVVVPPLLNLEGREIYYNQGISGVVSRFIGSIEQRKIVIYLLSLFLISSTSYFTFFKRRDNLQFSLFIITLNLIDSLAWQHHFVWLIFAFCITVLNIPKDKKFYLFLVFLSYLLISWNFKAPPVHFSFAQALIYSHVFWGTLLLYFINLRLLLIKNTTS